MGTFLASYDLNGEAIIPPRFEEAPLEDIARATAAHRWLEQQAELRGKRINQLTRGEIEPDDITNARADRGTHVDPVGNGILARWNNWRQPLKRKYKFSDGYMVLTDDQIRALKDAGSGSGILPHTLTCSQVEAVVGGEAR
ncbi:hypothetical protein [Leifsonia sp. SIMBA_070]|uniref:hypothetical protein n=1 Tax=Leifsonia sp. SIMBA_070 TaxID=3085810 RepID=UPI0039795985